MLKTNVVKEQIIDMIQSDSYTSGQRLPSEPQMAESFSVSRETLLEAFKTACSGRSLVCKTRSWYVCDGAPSCHSKSLGPAILYW
ncbi:GntR family transcriptional regulator [Aureibacillus halotolerans]|uniref:Regulatory GntR family protein n=1 Tax=Aureibacillus halotolerans TaxID=1508390 RepID=A0A4R6U8P8_9BACI|nr:GntR family transcriptional regulator [Aureibacillus halotolerans]TDQ41169.1 regulatory GntR family protein [Aureibacillus halotolerans]